MHKISNAIKCNPLDTITSVMSVFVWVFKICITGFAVEIEAQWFWGPLIADIIDRVIEELLTKKRYNSIFYVDWWH